MTVTSIRRDTPNNVSIVRMTVDSTLAAVSAVGYITQQTPTINTLNGGPWQWYESDTVLVSATDTNGFFIFTDTTFSTLAIIASSTHGTISPGLANQIAYYPVSGEVLAGLADLPNAILATNSSGVPALTTTLPPGISISPGSAYSVYVAPDGSDTTGDGGINNPYQTIVHALFTITANSATNPFNIILAGGKYNETLILLKPFVNIFSYAEGTIVNNASPVGLDTSWAGTTSGMSYLANLTFTGSFNLSFASSSAITPVIQTNSVTVQGTYLVNGNSVGTPTANVSVYSYSSNFQFLSLDNATFHSFGNYYANTFTLGGGTATNSTNLLSIGDTYINIVTLTGQASGPLLGSYKIRSSKLLSTLVLSGANATLTIDVGSYVAPTVSGGAVIVLTSISNGLLANYTPANYTPVATAPDLTTSVHAHLRGIDAALGGAVAASTQLVYVSNSGSDTTGTGSFDNPYQTIAHTMNTITGPSSTNIYTIILLSTIYNETSQIALKENVNIFGYAQNTIINNTQDIIFNISSWTSSNPYSSYINFIINGPGKLNLNATLITAPSFGVDINMLNVGVNSVTQMQGDFYPYINQCFFAHVYFDSVYWLTSIGNTYAQVYINTISASLASNNKFFGDLINGLTISGSAGATCNVELRGTGSRDSETTTPITINGSNAILKMDAASYSTPGGSGATSATIGLINISNGLSANYTPVNYTPVATAPDLTTSVHAHLRGIDAALAGIGLGATAGQLVYVANNGSDSTGNGSFNEPFQTIAHAMASITTASPTNIYTIVLLSTIYNETVQITLKENVNIFAYSPNTQINNTATIIVNTASWGSANPISSYSNINFGGTSGGNINFDFTTLSAPLGNPTAMFYNCEFGGTFNYKGHGTTGVAILYAFSSVFFGNVFVDNTGGFSSTGNTYYGSLNFGTISVLKSNHSFMYGDYHFGSGLVISGSAGASQQYTLAACSVSSITINGSNATLITDAVSYVAPTVTGTPTITLQSISNGLKANYTPVNYTPVATAPDLVTSVHAHLAGIDNAIGGVLKTVLTPTTGNTITLSTANRRTILNPAGTLAALTINMPSAPADGQLQTTTTTQIITALTVSGNGHTIIGQPTALVVGQGFTMVYNLATTTWYPA